MADWLNQRLAETTRILVSPAVRTQQTAKALDRSFKTVQSIAPDATVEAVLKAVRWPDSNEPVLYRLRPGAHTLDPNQFDGSPVTPGSAFKLAKDAFPDDSTPVAYGKFLAQLPFGLSGDPTPPGQGTKTFTPGCSSGRNLNICTSG